MCDCSAHYFRMGKIPFHGIKEGHERKHVMPCPNFLGIGSCALLQNVTWMSCGAKRGAQRLVDVNRAAFADVYPFAQDFLPPLPSTVNRPDLRSGWMRDEGCSDAPQPRIQNTFIGWYQSNIHTTLISSLPRIGRGTASCTRPYHTPFIHNQVPYQVSR